MAVNIARFNVSFVGNAAGLSRVMLNVQNSTDRLKGSLEGITGVPFTRMNAALASSAALATAFAAALTKAASEAIKLDTAVARATAIAGDFSPELGEKLEREAIRLSAASQKTAEEIVQASFFLQSAGFSLQESIAGLSSSVTFAQAGNFDLSQAVDLSTDALTAMGLEGKNAAETIRNLTFLQDQLIKANVLANATTEQFSIALQQAGPVAAALGVSTAETLATLSLFADAGSKAEEGGNALKRVLLDVTSKVKDNTAAFEGLGIDVFDDQGGFRGPLAVLQDIENALAGMTTEAQRFALIDLGFQDKSLAPLLATLGRTAKGYERLAELQNATGTANEVAERSMTELAKATAEFNAAWEALGASLADNGFLASVVSLAASVVDSFAALSDLMKGLSQTFKPELEALAVLMRDVNDAFEFLVSLPSGLLRYIVGDANLVGDLPEMVNAVGDAAERAQLRAEIAANAMADATEKVTQQDREAATAATESIAKMRAEADKLVESLKTPEQKLNDQIAQWKSLTDAQGRMLLNQEQLNELIKRGTDELNRATDEANQRSIEALLSQTETRFDEIYAQFQEAERLFSEGLFSEGLIKKDQFRAIGESLADQFREPGKALEESLRTPLERFQDSVDEAAELLAAGQIGESTFERAVAAARKDLEAAEQSAKNIYEFGQAGGRAAGTAQTLTTAVQANAEQKRIATESARQTSIQTQIRDSLRRQEELLRRDKNSSAEEIRIRIERLKL